MALSIYHYGDIGCVPSILARINGYRNLPTRPPITGKLSQNRLFTPPIYRSARSIHWSIRAGYLMGRVGDLL